jgi:uncharacterized protein YceK
MRTIYAVLTALTLSGCATVMHGTEQEVSFASTPADARVTVDSQSIGNTPVMLDLSRKRTHVVRIELDGYAPYEANITRHTSGWVLGNLLIGGVVGIAVDAIGGGLYNLSPSQLEAQLGTTASVEKTKDGMAVMVVLKSDPAWQRIGTLSR